MIRHNDTSPDRDIELALGAFSESNQSSMNCGASKTWLSMISAKCNEIEWGCGKDSIKSKRAPLELFWHMNL